MTYAESIAPFFGKTPAVHPSAFVAPGAVVLGDVTLDEETSVWFSAVVRADIHAIRIGRGSNIQDGAVVHVDRAFPTIVGEYVTCGHRAILHACRIDDEVLVGMGATILDGAEIGARSIIGANALVTMGTKIPPGSLVLGMPAKVVRPLDREQQATIRGWADRYVELARAYLEREA